MLFIGGIICVIIGIIMVIRVLLNSKRPRIDGARVVEVTKEFYVHHKTGQRSPRPFPHAKVEFFHDGEKHTEKILLKSKAKPGDEIRLSVNPKAVPPVEEFYPTKEILISCLIILIGAVFMYASYVMIQRLEE